MNPSPDITSMLGSLLSDPQMLSKVISMASTLKESGLFDALSGNFSNPEGENGENNEGGERSDEITGEHPDSGERAPFEKNISGDNDNNEFTGDNDDSDDKENRKRSGAQGGFFEKNSAERNRMALISALKPYLSQEKREKAEMLLTILGILGSVSAFRKRN